MVLAWLHCSWRVAVFAERVGALRAVAVGKVWKVVGSTRVRVTEGMVV